MYLSNLTFYSNRLVQFTFRKRTLFTSLRNELPRIAKLRFDAVEKNPGQELDLADEIYNSLKGKVAYNSYVKKKNDLARFAIMSEEKRKQAAGEAEVLTPVSLRHVYGLNSELEPVEKKIVQEEETDGEDKEGFHLPYSIVTEVEMVPETNVVPAHVKEMKMELLQMYQDVDATPIHSRSWMSDYEYYDEREEDDDSPIGESNCEYGTANAKIRASNVPCGGCGAFLHCREPAIPGYLPQELFTQYTNKELAGIKCQRCSFLQNYNTALKVNVDPNIYPLLISKIKEECCLVILMVDMTDFPCSIWPGITNVIGKKPVIVVGNKIDLIPGDCPGWVDHAKKCLMRYLPKTNVIDVALTSAKTGYGIEKFISKIFASWNAKGDVYIIGCTNVGKSSMFNALINSDVCFPTAIDVMQRATTSPWPGTTLNLLKFPMVKLSAWKAYLRTCRLRNQQTEEYLERKLRILESYQFKTRFSKLPQIIGNVGLTVTKPPSQQRAIVRNLEDQFAMPTISQVYVNRKKATFLPDIKMYRDKKWCYDTPGVVHDDQIINLLTTDELMKIIPQRTIQPKVFVVRPEQTLFIGGVARIDVLSCEFKYTRMTVYASKDLPITVCATKYAEEVYETLVGTPFMAVPCGSVKRLDAFPPLKYKEDFEVKGGGYAHVTCDIVLSNAGWISISAPMAVRSLLRPWTPEGRGIYLRKVPLLRYPMSRRGKRIANTPTYVMRSL